jgi:hypothetical protein
MSVGGFDVEEISVWSRDRPEIVNGEEKDNI